MDNQDQVTPKDQPAGEIVGDDFEAAIEAGYEPGEDEPSDDEPQDEPQGEPDPGPGKEPQGEPDPTMRKLDEVLEAIKARNVAKTEPEADPGADPGKAKEAAKPEVPAHLKALLEHDDPDVRAAADAMLAEHRANTERLDRLEQHLVASSVQAAAEAFDQDIEAVAARCNPPLTDDEQAGLVDWLIKSGVQVVTEAQKKNNALDGSLSFSDAVNVRFPGRMKPPTSTEPPAGAPKGAEGARPSAKATDRPAKPTVIDRSGADGKPTAVQPREPRNISEAVDLAFDGKL